MTGLVKVPIVFIWTTPVLRTGSEQCSEVTGIWLGLERTSFKISTQTQSSSSDLGPVTFSQPKLMEVGETMDAAWSTLEESGNKRITDSWTVSFIFVEQPRTTLSSVTGTLHINNNCPAVCTRCQVLTDSQSSSDSSYGVHRLSLGSHPLPDVTQSHVRRWIFLST